MAVLPAIMVARKLIHCRQNNALEVEKPQPAGTRGVEGSRRRGDGNRTARRQDRTRWKL